MRRREFITLLGGSALALPIAARAQQPGSRRRVGMLMSGVTSDPEGQARVAAFVHGLQQLGWTEGGNIDIDIRWGAGEFPGLRATLLFKEDVFPVCARELVAGADPLRSPDDLARHTLLHLDWNPMHASWPTWSDWLKAAGARNVDARHGVFFNNMAMTLRAAAQGQGVALTSFAIAADSTKTKSL